jgi:hypothetical protein
MNACTFLAHISHAPAFARRIHPQHTRRRPAPPRACHRVANGPRRCAIARRLYPRDRPAPHREQGTDIHGGRVHPGRHQPLAGAGHLPRRGRPAAAAAAAPRRRRRRRRASIYGTMRRQRQRRRRRQRGGGGGSGAAGGPACVCGGGRGVLLHGARMPRAEHPGGCGGWLAGRLFGERVVGELDG